LSEQIETGFGEEPASRKISGRGLIVTEIVFVVVPQLFVAVTVTIYVLGLRPTLLKCKQGFGSVDPEPELKFTPVGKLQLYPVIELPFVLYVITEFVKHISCSPQNEELRFTVIPGLSIT
jgi:hypothetical protein